ncbi:unnamed protein product [Rotaria sp. Silwood2]|nr:unnamed protein product [Rotaria sp. Silwood2]CAF4380627.1 unnamed protein product [Rotaria sp. Silwood2]
MYAEFKARWREQQTVTDQKLTRNSKSIEIVKLWNRLNKDGLTPLTLAADLGQAKMLSWLLYERKKIQWSYGNVSCVLHPLDQFDLDFQKEGKQRPLSVLEVMIKNNDPKLVHPIIISLIDKKWKQFAYRILIRRFFLTFVYLLSFLITTILEQAPSETTADENDKTVTTDGKSLDFSRQIISAVGRFIVIEGALWKSAYEINEMCTLGLWNYWNSAGSIFLENFLACSFCFCIFTVKTLRLFDMQHETVILAFTSLLGWSYMFFFTMPFRFTGPFVIMIYKMLFNDVLRFCIIYIIFLTGFSQCFFILFNGNGLQGYISSIKQCFLGLLGNFDLDYYIEGPYPLVGALLLILYVVVISILLLNLLIAMMGDTYADVKKSAKKLWHLERARIALNIESRMSTSKRQLNINKYRVDVQGERYLQVEQVNDALGYPKDDEANDDE